MTCKQLPYELWKIILGYKKKNCYNTFRWRVFKMKLTIMMAKRTLKMNSSYRRHMLYLYASSGMKCVYDEEYCGCQPLYTILYVPSNTTLIFRAVKQSSFDINPEHLFT